MWRREVGRGIGRESRVLTLNRAPLSRDGPRKGSRADAHIMIWGGGRGRALQGLIGSLHTSHS